MTGSHVLTRSYRLFVVASASILPRVGRTTSALTLTGDQCYAPILRLRRINSTTIIVARPSSNLTLTRCVRHSSSSFLDCSTVQSVIKRYARTIRRLLSAKLARATLDASAVHIDIGNIRFTSAPITTTLTSVYDNVSNSIVSCRRVTAQRLTTLLCTLLAGAPSNAGAAFSLGVLPTSIPARFHIVYGHKLTLRARSKRIVIPVTALTRLDTLLNT